MIAALYAIPYVGPFVAFALSRFGLPIVVAGGIIFFYEGVPLGPLADIPYVGPELVNLVGGRVGREYAAGQKAEDALWQEKIKLAGIAQAADTKTRQQDIDAAAQAYIDKQHSDAGRIADLERAQKDEDNAPPDPKNPSGCKPDGISAGVSERLDAIGR
ncbi:hypothetical protein LB531_21260 [Mesorhizobium sp. CO1-1-2]|uniref:hypothetical protein n=1 Tax=Mesorhizobium sp. CO1-1-2 TaxID=2876635 RepID=UPI001CD013F1|nr:hypothetical protein [Mesorhizobium sp. CO1-1-2]MBZ9683190.1 hypothetical protein [Mesorhizobium sp. CO1-1-2]